MFISKLILLLAVTAAYAAPVAEDAIQASSQFSASKTFTFTGSTLPAGLQIDTGLIGKTKPSLLNHRFDKKNVAVKDGFLQLTVPGGQSGQKTISSAEVATTFDMLYGSVTTWAILTDTAGVCNGNFFYKSDNQESDIEWISDKKSKSNLNSPNGTRAMQYTNQAVRKGGKPTMVYGPAPEDATSAVHAYRIDWTEGKTEYYLDDVLQVTMTTNVPSQAGPWLWNNWNDGDPFWTGPPPKTDAVFKIQKIEMQYNPA